MISLNSSLKTFKGKNLNGRGLDVDFSVEVGQLLTVLEDRALQVDGALVADDLALVIGKALNE